MEERNLKREGLEMISSSEKQISGGYAPPTNEIPTVVIIIPGLGPIPDKSEPIVFW